MLNNIQSERDILGSIFGATFYVCLNLDLPVDHQVIASAYEPSRYEVQNWQFEEISSSLDSLALEEQPHLSILHL